MPIRIAFGVALLVAAVMFVSGRGGDEATFEPLPGEAPAGAVVGAPAQAQAAAGAAGAATAAADGAAAVSTGAPATDGAAAAAPATAGAAAAAAPAAGPDAAAAGAAPGQAATTPSGAEPEAAPEPVPAASARIPAGDPSGPILRAVDAGKVAVLLVFEPGGADDRAARAAVRRLDDRGGRVVKSAVPVQDVGRLEALVAAGLEIRQAPTVVVLGPGRRAKTVVGFTERAEVEQAVGDLLRTAPSP